RQAVAVPRRLQRPAATEDLDERQFQGGGRVRYADEHHRARKIAGGERLLIHRRVADGFDADVGAVAVGDRLDVLDGVGGLRVDGVRGAEVLRPRQLLVVDVDGDHLGGTGEARTCDRRVTDTAASEDGDRVA